MVRGARVHRQPAYAALQHPLGEGSRGSRVADEVLRLVDLGEVGPVLGVVLVVAGVDDQDVAALDPEAGLPLPALEVLGAVQLVVTDSHALQVDHARGPDQEVERQVADELAAGEEVRGSIEMGADVERGGDLLAAGLVEGQALDPLHAGPVVAGEGRRVDREVLGQVEQLHGRSE